MIVDYAEENPDGWIVGRGWDQNDWAVNEYPTRTVLDSLFPDRPIFIKRIDGHAALTNAVGLKAGGVTSQSTIDGGEILMMGEIPSGVLIDNAADLVEDSIPQRSSAYKHKALLDAQENCFAVGLTTVSDAGMDKDEIELIQKMHEEGALKMRIYAMLSDNKENLDHYLASGPVKTDRLDVRSFKFYADGALGSRGACLISPYSDVVHGKHLGFMLDNIEYYREYARLLYDAGFQMNTHCIGDSANRVILDIYGSVLQGENDRRWRIEHAQVVHKKDIEKFAAYSIVPSVQPTHATSDMYWAEQRLGRNRVRRAYAYKELKEQLGMIALGTDFPIEKIPPLHTYYAATVRKDHKDFPQSGFQSENALDRMDALKGMTLWAAMANFQEMEKGSLESGKFADLVILDRDIISIPADEILQAEVTHTLLNGEIVFETE
jgi:predicted amidohydrolase YtcJ